MAAPGPLHPRDARRGTTLICLGTRAQLGELLAVATRGLRQPVSESTDTLLLFGISPRPFSEKQPLTRYAGVTRRAVPSGSSAETC